MKVKDLSFENMTRLDSYEFVKIIYDSLKPSSNTNKSRTHLVAFLDFTRECMKELALHYEEWSYNWLSDDERFEKIKHLIK